MAELQLELVSASGDFNHEDAKEREKYAKAAGHLMLLHVVSSGSPVRVVVNPHEDGGVHYIDADIYFHIDHINVVQRLVAESSVKPLRLYIPKGTPVHRWRGVFGCPVEGSK